MRACIAAIALSLLLAPQSGLAQSGQESGSSNPDKHAEEPNSKADPIEAQLLELRILDKQLTERQVTKQDAHLIKRYDTLHKELHEERLGLIRLANRANTAREREVYTERYRKIGATLDVVTPPGERYTMSASEAWRQHLEDSHMAQIEPRMLMNEATKAINGSDQGAAERMLARMRRYRDDIVRYGVGSRDPGPEFFGEFSRFIKDYEKALIRKWPMEPKNSASANSLNVQPDRRNPSGPPPGAVDPMRRHGLTDPLAPTFPPAKAMPSTWDANVMRNRMHREQNSAGTGPGSQRAPTPPPIGELPTVQGSPQGTGPIDMPVNGPG
ncbi:MAG: hypothetical protein R3D89_03700 [Sphingomonadaceae bacterium]